MPAVVLEWPRRAGKTALMWHLLRQESLREGRAVVCARCGRPYDAPPPLGKCPCGSYLFGLAPQSQLPLHLPSDVHGGEV